MITFLLKTFANMLSNGGEPATTSNADAVMSAAFEVHEEDILNTSIPAMLLAFIMLGPPSDEMTPSNRIE